MTSIDQASVEVLTVIKVVVERMRRAAEGREVGAAWGGGGGEEHAGVGVRVGGGEGRWVQAGQGFMLFATRSVSSSSSSSTEAPAFFTAPYWSEIRRPALEGAEVHSIVSGRYPALERAALAERLIRAWEKVKGVESKEGVSAGTARSVGVRDLMR